MRAQLAANLAANLAADLSALQAEVLGLSNLSATAYAESASPGGVAGVASGYTLAYGLHIPTQAVASLTRGIYSRLSNGVGGHRLVSTGTLMSLSFQVYDGTLALINGPSYTFVPGDIAKIIGVVVQHDGSFLRMWVNKVQVGTGVSINGFTPASTVFRLGRTNSGTGAEGITVIGGCGGHFVANQSQIEAWYDAFKAQRKVVAFPGIATARVWPVTGLGTLIEAGGSGDNLALVGSPTLARLPATFGW